MLKNLTSLSRAGLKSFLGSFDTVLCDCDGVVWKSIGTPLPGTKDSFHKLKSLGKKVRFVTNNTYYTLDEFQKTLAKYQFDVQINDIVSPTATIIDYLKKRDFKKQIHLFGLPALKQELQEAGYKIAHSGPTVIEDRIEDLIKHMNDNEDVGAVILDNDLNVNYTKLMKALVYLQRSDVLFLVGGDDTKIILRQNILIIGPGCFRGVLEQLSGRQATVLGKPSNLLNDYIVKKYDIQDPSRVLFVGDNLRQDMAFAGKFGYQKLLILTGVSSLEEAKQVRQKEAVPDYYLNTFADLHRLLAMQNI